MNIKMTNAQSLNAALTFLTALLLAPLDALHAGDAKPGARPNVLWFVVDDMSANFSCYGETHFQRAHSCHADFLHSIPAASTNIALANVAKTGGQDRGFSPWPFSA